jgi:hypothetical protein
MVGMILVDYEDRKIELLIEDLDQESKDIVLKKFPDLYVSPMSFIVSG